MKLAIVTAFPPSQVTLNEYGYHLVKHFAKKNKITELILLTDRTTGDKDIVFTEQNCKITVKQCWSFNSYLNLLNINKAIRQTTPDAVLLNVQFMKFGDKKIAAALGLLIPLMCKIMNIPNIVLLHNILEQVDLEKAGFTGNKLLKKLYSFIGTTLTRCILKADLVALTMHKYIGVLEKKYKAYNLVNVPHGTFEIPEQPKHLPSSNSMKIMTFGKFGTYKKVEVLIEAIELVRAKTNFDLELVIAGTDNPNVPGYLEGVKETYKHVPNITYTGYVAEEAVPSLFQESAVVVFPYTSTTGSSGVLHQAGSYGKAVVMPNLGDLTLLVEDEGYKAEFFQPTDSKSLATAIENIVTNDEHRKYLEEANYNAAKSIPMEDVTDKYIALFEILIEKKQYQNITLNRDSSLLI